MRRIAQKGDYCKDKKTSPERNSAKQEIEYLEKK